MIRTLIPHENGAIQTSMLNIQAITDQILMNCDITDSQHAGRFSICGLALRLRDLYKWEKGSDPWVEKGSAEMLQWIEDKEQKWDRLADKQFNDIRILGSTYDPFDTTGINSVLEPHGLYYGGGYAGSLKPTFFLAAIEAKRQLDGHDVYILGQELARDLLTIPALSQDDCILIRQEPAKLFLWDNIFYIKKSGRPALRFALEKYGIKDNNYNELKKNLGRIAKAEMGTYIYHELGELKDSVFDRSLWREIVATFPHTPVELLARSIKDLLADTNEFGTLSFIVRERKTASLAFYVAFLEGLIKELFPEIIHAFQEFTFSNNWQVIAQAVTCGHGTAKRYAESIRRIYQEGKQKNNMQWVENEIARRFLKPLGITGTHPDNASIPDRQ